VHKNWAKCRTRQGRSRADASILCASKVPKTILDSQLHYAWLCIGLAFVPIQFPSIFCVRSRGFAGDWAWETTRRVRSSAFSFRFTYSASLRVPLCVFSLLGFRSNCNYFSATLFAHSSVFRLVRRVKASENGCDLYGSSVGYDCKIRLWFWLIAVSLLLVMKASSCRIASHFPTVVKFYFDTCWLRSVY